MLNQQKTQIDLSLGIGLTKIFGV